MAAKRSRLILFGLLVAALVAAFAFTASFPEVKGLGAGVRLPIFHGALTWVNLMAFAALGFASVVALVTRRDSVYRWEQALRWVSIPMWLVGSVLGLLAAMNTWDFTGSKASRLEVVSADPRLTAQFWILLAGLALLAFALMIDDRRWMSVLDTGFVVLAWAVLMRAILGPGRALHPDSPVMNSEELGIKLLFFGIVGSLALATVAASWLLSSRTGAQGEALPAS